MKKFEKLYNIFGDLSIDALKEYISYERMLLILYFGICFGAYSGLLEINSFELEKFGKHFHHILIFIGSCIGIIYQLNTMINLIHILDKKVKDEKNKKED
jgi:hypothetical protein